jgi:tRNA pseudouridine55 synthase
MPYVSGLPKHYEGTIRLGIRTDTDDRAGAVLATSDAWRDVDDESLDAAMGALTGHVAQVPPVYSAKKVAGAPAYRRARRGETVSLAAREVDVVRFAPVDRAGPDVRFEAEVGSGTYVRALARDLGERLGCGAHLLALRRTAVGPWAVADAVPLDGLTATPLRPLSAAVPHLSRRALDDLEHEAVRRGRAIDAHGEGAGAVALFHGSDLVAVAEREGETLHPHLVLDA